MKMNCLGCGAEKDTEVQEPYPYPEDERLCDGPISPLFVLECQPNESKELGWRMAVVCHECFKKLDPDMWISENCWISLNPKTPFKDLPLYVMSEEESKWDPMRYATDTGGEFKPDWYSPPGDTVQEALKDRGISFQDFAKKIFGDDQVLTASFLMGKERLTPEIAQQLSELIGVTPEFWLKREATYRADKKRITGSEE